MTKEDYERIATVLNVTRNFLDEGPNSLAESMADTLAAADPEFDRLTFLQAAGARDEWNNPAD